MNSKRVCFWILAMLFGVSVFAQSQNSLEKALFDAIGRKDYQTVEQLVDYGVNTNYVNNNGDTPLLYAVKTQYMQVIKLLLNNGANPNYKNDYRESCLILATKKDEDFVMLKYIK